MRNNAVSGAGRPSSGLVSNYSGGSYRGRGGGYNSRGGGMHNNFNRGGYRGGMQNSGMGNFSQMGSVPSYGGYQSRGGMMGGMQGPAMNMRGGGRGGMMGMPMGMGMGSMAMGMGMGPMGGMGMAGK